MRDPRTRKPSSYKVCRGERGRILLSYTAVTEGQRTTAGKERRKYLCFQLTRQNKKAEGRGVKVL